MEKYAVSGMSCAACVARVEKAVSKVPGVTSCSVSLLTNSMGVEGNAKSSDVILAVTHAGYSAKILGSKEKSQKKSTSSLTENKELLENKETSVLVKRLIFSAIFLFVLMYLSMGHTMWNWPLPSWFSRNGENYIALGLAQMILAAIVMIINKKFFVSGFKSAIHGSPNMDTLVAMGSGVSFLYSVFMLFGMTDAVLEKNNEVIMNYTHTLYFESAAMIVTLITVGKLLESISKGKTTNALKSLMKLAPKTAVLLKDGKEITVEIDQVQKDDIFLVRPGENIPVDGIILEGNTAVNEAALTGESIPVDKSEGDKVSAATINHTGFIKCKATEVGEDTTLSKIIQMVSDAAATKAPIAKIADKVSGIFVPAVLGIAALSFIIWLISGADFSFSLNRAISVLVVSCPCALGLATPVAIMVGSGMGAKNGILFKTSAALEIAGKTQIVVLDKTGTITKGEPLVTDIISFKTDEKEFIKKAASLEAKSEHPLAKAILKKADEYKIKTQESLNFTALPGNGLSAVIDGKKICGGNFKYIESVLKKDEVDEKNFKSLLEKSKEFSEQGKTPLFFTEEGKLLGIIAVSDVLKDDSPKAVRELQNMKIKVIMLTGDNEKTAKAVGKKAGVDQVIAGVLPDEKEKFIEELKKSGKVCMVGDGINDAPALTSADLGMAIGNGTDVAIDAADVILLKNSLCDVAAAIRLSKQTLRNIHENLFWAFFYNIILIPLAAGVYYPWLGLSMNPMFGALAMSLSSFCVITNALRLNLFNIKNPHKKVELKKEKASLELENKNKETKIMATEKTLKIEGMMCPNCERHVKEALEKIDGVESATADHTKSCATVKLTKEVPESEFEKTITNAGYTFVKN